MLVHVAVLVNVKVVFFSVGCCCGHVGVCIGSNEVVVVVVFAEKAMTAVFVVAMAIANLADCTRDTITYSDMVLARKEADSLL